MELPLKRGGYIEAAGIPQRLLHDDTHILDLRVSFTRGPMYHFGQLHLEGLLPMLEAQARSIWRMHPGDPLDYVYPNEFLQAFLSTVDSRQFNKFSSKLEKGAGDHVMDVTLTFVPR